MKFYIATRLDNQQSFFWLRDVLTAGGHRVSYDWTADLPVQGGGLERLRELALREARGVLEADVLILLWPGGRGAHVELGLALGAGKPVILISDEEGHHHASPVTCAFYHHPLVRRGRRAGEVPALLAALS